MASHLLLGCTGSVASIKIPKLVEQLFQANDTLEIKVVATAHALHFFNQDELPVQVYTDDDEWKAWSSIQDPVLHIELRKWADVLLLAPLGANTMAKVAGGMCDNLLTCVVRAWEPKKPVLFAPSMNNVSWAHPVTAQHVEKLKSYGYTEVPCVTKKLACGDIGHGAMADVSTLVSAVEGAMTSRQISPARKADSGPPVPPFA